MAVLDPHLDLRAGLTAPPARHHTHASAVGPVLGHSHDVHTRRPGVQHGVGGDRRQPVRQQRSHGRGRRATRHHVSSLDRACHPHAALLRHGHLRHGGHRHRQYLHITLLRLDAYGWQSLRNPGVVRRRFHWLI